MKAKHYRNPSDIFEEIRELDRSSLFSRQYSTNHPDDKVVQLVLLQDENRKNELLAEFKESQEYYRIHSLGLALKTTKGVEVDSLGLLLSAIKKAWMGTLEIFQKPKVPLNFYLETTYHSSYGIFLSTDWDPKLFDSGYEVCLSNFFTIVEKLKKAKFSRKPATYRIFQNCTDALKDYRAFFRLVTELGCDIEVTWNGVQKKQEKKTYISTNISSRIYSGLVRSEKDIAFFEEKEGTIVGISLIDRTIQFVPQEKEGVRISLSFTEDHLKRLKPLLGERIVARYKVMEIFSELRNTTIKSRSLTSFHAQPIK